ncbi:hypothetical protein Hdeb2414_s0087g00785941 [Helianthus debilis subsp. tardiflorus]
MFVDHKQILYRKNENRTDFAPMADHVPDVRSDNARAEKMRSRFLTVFTKRT